MTDNELIAEFMDWQHCNSPTCLEANNLCWNKDCNSGYISKDQLKSHTSWDWLMPVVEKIESLGYATKFRYEAFTSGPENAYHDIEIFSLNENNGYKRVACCMDRIPKIQAVYKAVVEFIKWYNSNHPQP